MQTQKTFPNQRGAAYIFGSADIASGIDVQLRQIEARAKQDGVEIIEVYADEQRATKPRPRLDDLLGDAKSGKFEVLYCLRLDSLSSELHCVIKIAGHLIDNDIVIRTIEQNLDTKSPEGKLMLHMLIALGKHWPGLPNCEA